MLVLGVLVPIGIQHLATGFRNRSSPSSAPSTTPTSGGTSGTGSCRPQSRYASLLNGTPFKPLIWRLLGVRMGSRVFDDGCGIIERTLVTVGSRCTLNNGTTLQSHSQEDGMFKSDHIVVGDDVTLGVAAFVHYGVTVEDGARCRRRLLRHEGDDPHPRIPVGWQPGRRGPSPLHVPPRTGKARVMTTTSALTCRTAAATRRARAKTEPRPRVPRRRRFPDGHRTAGRVRDESKWRCPRTCARPCGRCPACLEATPASIWLAAHSRVLQALSGETEVTTGCRDAFGTWPCDLDLATTVMAGAGLRGARPPSPGPRRSNQWTPGGASPSRPPRPTRCCSAPIRTTIPNWRRASSSVCPSDDARMAKRSPAYRRDVLDADAARRIAGYHLSALRSWSATPGRIPPTPT